MRIVYTIYQLKSRRWSYLQNADTFEEAWEVAHAAAAARIDQEHSITVKISKRTWDEVARGIPVGFEEDE